MSDENKPVGWENLPSVKIIQQIKDGLIDPKEMPIEMRQAIVECLLCQFMKIPQIAAFLKKTDRTIQRDEVEINIRNSRKPSPDYALELITELKRKSTATQEQLMTLAKSEDGSVQEKSQAAFFLWKTIQEEMKLLQSLGYLPEQPFRLEATLTQKNERDIPKLKTELAEAEKVASETDRTNNPTISGLIKSIKQDIAIAEANNKMDELKKLIDESKKDTDNSK
jgi:hypothetical protein